MAWPEFIEGRFDYSSRFARTSVQRETGRAQLVFFSHLSLHLRAFELLALWKGWRKLEFVAKPAVMVCLFIWLVATAGLQGALLWFGVGILFY